MTRINLLYPRLPSPEMVRVRRFTTAGSLLLLAVAVSLVVYLLLVAEQGSLKARLATVEAQIAAEQVQVDEWKALTAAIRETEGRAQIMSQIPLAGGPFADLTRAVAAALPAGCQVRGVTVEPGGALVLEGTAGSHADVALYLDQLRAAPGLGGIALQSSARPPQGGPVTFNLRGQIQLTGGGAAERGQGQ